MQKAEINGMEALERVFKNLPGQLAFASAKAINDTAVEVQNFEVSKELPSNLTLRAKGTPWQKPGTRYGVNIKPFATKQNPRAVVGTQADWLRLQESGGTKRATGHRIAIPTSFWKSDKDILAKSKKPRTLIAAKRRRAELAGRAFIYEGGKMPHGIYARNKRKSRALRMLFRFVTSAQIRSRISFVTHGMELAQRLYQDNFKKRVKEALETAKLR